MTHRPDLEEFRRLRADGRRVPVYRRLTGDFLTPVRAYRALDSGPSACLLESVIGGERMGRYSILFVDPLEHFSARRDQVTVIRYAGPGGPPSVQERFTCPDPLDELRRRIGRWRVAPLPGLPPFLGGAVGFAGYDVVRYIENLPHAPPDDRDLPDLAFDFFDQVVFFDNAFKNLTVAVLGEAEGDAETAYAQACRRVDGLVDRLSNEPPAPPLADLVPPAGPPLEWRANRTREDYEAAVRQALEYIRAGDIFQVVLSQRLEVRPQAGSFDIYRMLRTVNPSPFMFHLRQPEVTLVGSSPEVMVRVNDRQVTVRPLAGTRPRGATPAEDEALAAELLADPKERAEHVMLVDLGRNDVGRVARFGSVELSDVMVVERYSHVMHITSNVTARLADGQDAFDALRACLPAGTVSGAPKVRAMQIIDELEPHRRGPYAGAVGYIDFQGNMDTCIALRTLVVQGDRAYIQAGAGLVADSDPAAEYQETLNKARGLLQAVDRARALSGS